jgi:CBS domain containing-hemolysin-like protein
VNVEWIEGVILVLSLILAAMSAAAETAFTALPPATIHTLEERGGVGKVIAYLKHEPNRFLSTILIISSTSLIVTSSMATLLLARLLSPPWSELTATIGLSIVVLILAELTPKNLAVRNPTPISIFLARPVRVSSILLAPVIASTGAVVGFMLRLLGQGGGMATVVPQITEDDVRSTIALAEESEGLTEEETDRIEGILDLDTVVVERIMRPRRDIIAVPVDTPLPEALDVVLREGHSRIPVYEESIDDIVGILYDKDLLKYLRENETNVSLREIAREPLFVPESKRAADLLRDFQRVKVHLAIVFDQFGGTAGLVTIEDILEEIVGEIQDEYDQEEPMVVQEGENQWLVAAILRIEEVNDELGLELEAEDSADTLGGFIVERLGEVPEMGDAIEADHARLEVIDLEGRRITKVRVTRLPSASMPEGELEEGE